MVVVYSSAFPLKRQLMTDMLLIPFTDKLMNVLILCSVFKPTLLHYYTHLTASFPGQPG